MPLEKNLQVREIKIWLKMRMIIHKPRRKAVCITVAGVLTGIAGEVIRGAEPPKNKKGLHPRRYRPFSVFQDAQKR